MESPASVAVLVVSCDNYSDLWQPFFSLMQRFWGDCPYPVYLLTNHLQPEFEGVGILRVGDDISWSDNLRTAVEQLPHSHVFLMLEDLMLTAAINTPQVERVFQWALKNDVNYVRMNPTIRADKPYNELVGVVSKGTIYRASVVMPLFKKSLLLQMLKKGENAWEFEYYGTERSDSYDGFYATHYDYFPNMNTIIKRVWEYDAARYISDLGVDIDFSKRRVMNTKERIIWKLKLLRTSLFHLVPPPLRRTIKEIVAGKKPSL